MKFREKLEAAWQRSGSLLCIGLDPEPALMPVDDIAAFNIAIIEATSDLVCAYKPNVAFYEALGPERGYAELRKTLAAIPAHIVTLADAKRGDVTNTARAYAKAVFDELGFDACTVNPYVGFDSTEPWFERPDKGAFILCRTSNPGAADLQDLRVVAEGGSMPLYEAVAAKAGTSAWSSARRTPMSCSTFASCARTCRCCCRALARSRAISRPRSAPASMPMAAAFSSALRAP